MLIGFLTITAFVVGVLGIPLGVVFARLERGRLVDGVRQDATTLALFAIDPLQAGSDAPLREVATAYRRRTGGRVVIVDGDGVARVDSDPSGPRESFARRPEIAGALEGRSVEGFRHSNTAGWDLFYVAVPINSGGVVAGAVRVTHPAGFVTDRIRRTWWLLTALAMVVLVTVAVVSRALARSVTAPLRRLAEAASALGEGHLDARVPLPHGPPELRLVSRVFNETAARVERLIDAHRSFAADASHQLRTPLAALRVRLEVAEKSSEGDARDDVRAALDETHRLSRLVEGLLALAAMDHRLAPAPVDVAAVVTARCDSWAALADEEGVRLEARVVPAVALLTPGVLDQVLDNLISNALEASPAGTTTTLSVVRNREFVDVHVADEGPGMSHSERAEAFVRRWRAPGSRLGGSGLGLAIVRRLVENDGGAVNLGVAPGGGLDVGLRLPAVGGGAGSSAPRAAPRRNAKGRRLRPGSRRPSDFSG